MAIACIVTKLCFLDGRRHYPGQKINFDTEGKLPSCLTPAEEYKEPKVDLNASGAGLVQKVDSISDVPLDGKEYVSEASQAASELASDFSINLDDVVGTGAKGQIIKADVQKFIEQNTNPDKI